MTVLVRVLLVVALVVVATALGAWWRRRDGRVRALAQDAADTVVGSAVLASTPTCRTCPQVRSLLAEAASLRGDFTWREVDVSTDPEFARRHRILRAPTVLFHDGAGTVVARASGALDRAQVLATVGVAPGH